MIFVKIWDILEFECRFFIKMLIVNTNGLKVKLVECIIDISIIKGDFDINKLGIILFI